MDVSKREARVLKMCAEMPNEMPSEMPNRNAVNNGEQLEATNLEGENLIQTLVALTGLPEGMANAEMNQILELSGHEPEKRSDITLDELRAALIAYLEALEPTCSE
ncbi:MAG: hypothetical protein ACJ763_18840 [Bdellovibrionia bacterium]